MNIIYSYYGAGISGETRHAQTVMRELGITYTKGEPRSVFDDWVFYGCENIPNPLPGYLTISDRSDEG